jgi:transcriptional regulator with XRE-family HTH domain
MRESGVGRSAIAAGAGISRTTLSNLRNERFEHPHIGTIRKLADYFGVTVDEFFAGPGSRSPTPITGDQLAEHGIAASTAELHALNQRLYEWWRVMNGAPPRGYFLVEDVDERRIDMLATYVLVSGIADPVNEETLRKALARM